LITGKFCIKINPQVFLSTLIMYDILEIKSMLFAGSSTHGGMGDRE